MPHHQNPNVLEQVLELLAENAFAFIAAAVEAHLAHQSAPSLLSRV